MTARDKVRESIEKRARLQTVLNDPRCTRLMVHLIEVLNEYANADRVAFPSFETLAFMTGAAEQNVKLAIKSLERLSYIEVDRDETPGRSRVNHYRLLTPPCLAPVQALRVALKAHRDQVKAEKEARRRDGKSRRSPTEKEARGRLKGARAEVLRVILACPDPLETSPPVDPGSDPNGSAAAFASASHSSGWKGTRGEPIPSGFPDAQAMADARIDVEIAGVDIDLAAAREAFRRHHYSVRCLLTDWPRSWAMWVEDAIARAEAAA